MVELKQTSIANRTMMSPGWFRDKTLFANADCIEGLLRWRESWTGCSCHEVMEANVEQQPVAYD